jgi:AcrR family transcriptional regulator
MPSVTRKPQATRQERRADIERKLLVATDRLMGDGASFTELSVDRLATEAGISRAGFYIYFEDKGHLLRRLAVGVFDDLAAAADRWWSVAARRDPADALAAMTGIVAGYRRHQALLIALNEMAAYDPQVSTAYREILTGIAERFVRVIEDGQADGSIRRELAPASTANALTWLVERACHQNLPFQEIEHDAELAETLTQVVVATLYLQATSAC